MDLGLEAQKFILVFFRVVSMLWFVPLLSSQLISITFKASISLLTAFLLYSTVPVAAPVDAFATPYLFLVLVFKEVVIGITVSFIVRILFASVTVAGDIISLQAGLSFARLIDPFTMNQTSILEQILNTLAIMIFFSVDAHYSIFRTLAASFRELPIGTAAIREPLITYIISSTAKIFSIGFKIGAPIIVTLFLVELSLGMFARMIPQVNVFIEGVPIKILIAMLVLTFSLAFIAPVIAGLFKDLDKDFLRAITLMV